MAIRVTCSSCHARFDVSDKFAGKEGPCPKCKKTIKVPAKSDEVVIHVPDVEGPKDSMGKSVLKPIARKETKITPLRITIVVGLILLALVVAFLLRSTIDDKFNFPVAILILGAIAIAPASIFAAYTFLRDQELDALKGQDLWGRVGICTGIYVALWLIIPVVNFSANLEAGDSMQVTNGISMGIMIALGAFAAMLLFQFDYLMGLLHYGMYLAICLLLRWIAGVGALPGSIQPPEKSVESETACLEMFFDYAGSGGLQATMQTMIAFAFQNFESLMTVV